jgi:predicted hydrocarbon binding protein
MHGIIFSELKKYVDTKLGADAWTGLLQAAGLRTKIYMPIQAYPDQEAVALVSAAAKMTGQPVDGVLQSFGEFIAPDLLRMYGALLKKGWKTLDILENTEETIHRVVRSQNPGADPPQLQCARQSATALVVTYTSDRRMCGVAKGIIRGIAAHLGEKVVVSESTCMLQGGTKCEISVRLES